MIKIKRVYPAIFERDPKAGFGVSIPDLHAYADGNDFEEAAANAKEAATVALCRLRSRNASIPEPSAPTEFELNSGEQIYMLEIDATPNADAPKQQRDDQGRSVSFFLNSVNPYERLQTEDVLSLERTSCSAL